MAAPPGGGIAVHAHNRCGGKELAHLPLDPLGTHPEVADRNTAATGAAGGHGDGVGAVVAHQSSPGSVQGQGNGAPGALHHQTALAAKQKAGVAPAIEEEQGLFAPAQDLLQRSQQGAAEDMAVSLLQLPAHIHYLYRRQSKGGNPVGQLQEFQVVPLALEVALEGGGGAAQKEHPFVVAAPPPGHLPGIVPGRLLLFVAALVFLVDDKDARPVQGSKDGRAGAQDHRGPPVPDPPPLHGLLGRGKAAVEDGQPAREARPEALHHLGSERYLRDQHACPAPLLQAARHRLQVDLGLAASGDAVQ